VKFTPSAKSRFIKQKKQTSNYIFPKIKLYQGFVLKPRSVSQVLTAVSKVAKKRDSARTRILVGVIFNLMKYNRHNNKPEICYWCGNPLSSDTQPKTAICPTCYELYNDAESSDMKHVEADSLSSEQNQNGSLIENTEDSRK
jgi:hypothetical protein